MSRRGTISLEWWLLLGLLALALLNGRDLMSRHLGAGQDSAQYLTSLAEFHQTLKAGALSPEWASGLGNGHGEPLFTFLPPGLYWIAEVFLALGFSFSGALNSTLLFGVLLAAAGAYCWSRRWLGPLGAWLCAVSYIYAPYFHTDLFVRGAYGEFMTFAAYPWAFWALDGLASTPRAIKFRLVVSLSVAAVFLLHNPAALIFLPLTFVYALFSVWGEQEFLPKALRALSFVALGAALSCFFWGPALILKDLTHSARLLNGYLNYSNHFIYLWQLFYSPWGYGILLPGAHDLMSQKFGEFHLLGVLLMSTVLFLRRQTKTIEAAAQNPRAAYRWLCFISAATFPLLFFTTAYSKFVWDRVGVLQYLEFPMRFMALASLLGSALLSASLLWLVHLMKPAAKSEWRRAAADYGLFLLVGALVVGINLPHARAAAELSLAEEQAAVQRISQLGRGANNKDEFLPLQVWIVPPYDPMPARAIVKAARITPIASDSQGSVFDIESADRNIVRLNQFWFPGWQVRLDGVVQSIDVSKVYGQMQIAVPSGRHRIEARFVGTDERRSFLWLSYSALGLLLVAALI